MTWASTKRGASNIIISNNLLRKDYVRENNSFTNCALLVVNLPRFVDALVDVMDTPQVSFQISTVLIFGGDSLVNPSKRSVNDLLVIV